MICTCGVVVGLVSSGIVSGVARVTAWPGWWGRDGGVAS